MLYSTFIGVFQNVGEKLFLQHKLVIQSWDQINTAGVVRLCFAAKYNAGIISRSCRLSSYEGFHLILKYIESSGSFAFNLVCFLLPLDVVHEADALTNANGGDKEGLFLSG